MSSTSFQDKYTKINSVSITLSVNNLKVEWRKIQFSEASKIIKWDLPRGPVVKQKKKFHLPVQGTYSPSWPRRIPLASKQLSHAPQLLSPRSRAWDSQLLKHMPWSTCSATRGAIAMGSPHTTIRVLALLTTTRGKPACSIKDSVQPEIHK